MKRVPCALLRPASLVTLTILGLVAPADAQQTPAPQPPPNAGQLLNETQRSLRTVPRAAPNVNVRPTPQPGTVQPGGETVAVREFRITGNTVLTEEALQAQLAPYRGRSLTFAQLTDAADLLTRYYHEHGYILAQAYLPVQHIQNGIVEITILEGRISEVYRNPQGRVRLRDSVVRGILDTIKDQRVATEAGIERGLLLLSDLPRMSVSSTLQPGKTVGTSALSVDYAEGPLVGAALSIDDYGSRFTGLYRPAVTLTLNDGLRIGDLFSLYGLITTTGGLKYISPSYLLPIDSTGTKLALGYTYLNYELGEDFEPLQAHGDGNVVTVSVWHPFVRSRKLNFIGTLSYDYKDLHDDIDAVNSHSTRDVNEFTLAFSEDNTDTLGGGGLNTLNLGLTLGNLSLNGAIADADQLPNGPHSEGRFARFNYGLSRLQNLGGNFGLYAAMNGQLANKNLDTSEQIVLGGPWGVRAYPVGEGSADQGYVINLELRYVLRTPHRVPGQMTAFVFYDYGEANPFHSPPFDVLNNQIVRRAIGIGFNWVANNNFALRTTYGWRGDVPATSERGHDQPSIFYFSLIKNF
jgi:hemolysin activation/secretion protein